MNDAPNSLAGRSNQDSGTATQDFLDDPRVADIVQQYMTELEQGKAPDRKEYLQRYPELAGAIGQCLDGLDLVRAHGGSRSKSGLGLKRGAEPAAGNEVPANPLGDFQIVREVARGGMGIVYEAIQLSLGRRVALKVLPFAATLDSRQLQRFKTEAQAAALLHHPNIVPVFAVGCERGVHFYAMQLIEGQSLAEMIRQLRRQAGMSTPNDQSSVQGVRSSMVLGNEAGPNSSAASRGGVPAPAPLPTGETVSQFHTQMSTQHASREMRFFRTAVKLMLQAAQALEHAHEFGIIHRDVKPANLLLDVNGVLWVTDFGLAQFHSDAGLTRTGDIPGTIRYMSPEQASGRRALLDQRSDVYSLGATFYEFLTLEPIFRGRDVQYLLNQILHTEPKPLRQIDKAIPVELETIILKAVSKNPDDRYRSAGALAADLQRYLDHKPILARRPTLVDRARKWSLRHPGAVAAGMLVLFMIATGLFVSNQLISSEQKKAEQRATEAEQRFQQARQAVDVLIEVSEGELVDNPMMIGTRQRLLGIALSYYQDFIEKRRGDAAAQGGLASVQERVKDILHELRVLQREIHIRLIGFPQVQKALDLSENQRSQLDAFLKTRQQDQESFEERSDDLNEDARRRRTVEILEDHELELEKILAPGQRDRLTQIVLQTSGTFAFRTPDIIDALELSAEQRKAIRDVERQFRPRWPWRGRESGAARSSAQPRPSRQEAMAKVLAILTDQQKQTWYRMIGEPFAELDDLLRFRGPPDRPMSPDERRDRQRVRSSDSPEQNKE